MSKQTETPAHKVANGVHTVHTHLPSLTQRERDTAKQQQRQNQKTAKTRLTRQRDLATRNQRLIRDVPTGGYRTSPRETGVVFAHFTV